MNTSNQSSPEENPAVNFTNNYDPIQAPNQMNYYHQSKSNNGNFEPQASNKGRSASLAMFALASIGLIVHVAGIGLFTRAYDVYPQKQFTPFNEMVGEKWFHVVFYLFTIFFWLYTIVSKSKIPTSLSILLAVEFAFLNIDLKEYLLILIYADSSEIIRSAGFQKAAQVAFLGGVVMGVAWFGKIFTF